MKTFLLKNIVLVTLAIISAVGYLFYTLILKK